MRPRGRRDSVAAAVGEAAGALRRRRLARRAYAKVYDEDGYASVVAPESAQAEALIAAAEAMVDAVDALSEREPRP